MAGLGVLHDTRFSFGSAGIIRYIDDVDKVIQVEMQKDVKTYINYMDNPEKSKGLFDASGEYITEAQRQNYVSYFNDTEKNKGLLWQDLFSFKNEWLAEHGLMNLETNEVDDKRLIHAVQCAMDSLIESEGLQNYKWIGAMHHNTDNRHFHIAGVELTPSREWKWHTVYKKDPQGRPMFDDKGHRLKEDYQVYQPTGTRQKKSLVKMKSVFVNQLIRSAGKLQRIDNIARHEVVQGVKNKDVLSQDNRPYHKELFAIYLKLPTDKRLWNMKNAKEHFFYKEVNTLTEKYLATDFKVPFNQWKKEMGALSNEYHHAYNTFEVSETDFSDPRMLKYVKEKETDLKKRVGNAVLSQLKDLDKLRVKSGMNRKRFVASLFKEGAIKPSERIETAYKHVKKTPNEKFPLKKKSPYSQLEVDGKLAGLTAKPIALTGQTQVKNKGKRHVNQQRELANYRVLKRVQEPSHSVYNENLEPPLFQKKSPQNPYKPVRNDKGGNTTTPASHASPAQQKRHTIPLQDVTKNVRVVYQKKTTTPQVSGFNQPRLIQRDMTNKTFYQLASIERNMKKASNKWKDKMAYDQLENEMMQQKNHTH